MTVAAVILAAGASRRLGQPKQLVAFRGRPLVRAAAEEALASACDRTLVVLGAHEAGARAALAGLRIDVAVSESWMEGMAASIRCGVDWVERAGCEAAVLIVCDQPALTASHLDRLVHAHRAGAAIVASAYAGAVGVPALFDRATFPALLALRGDEGARRVLRARAVATVAWPEGSIDLDTPEDLAALTEAP